MHDRRAHGDDRRNVAKVNYKLIKKGEKIMIKMRKIVIRVLKCLICFLTGGFANKKNGGGNAAC